MNTPSGGRTKLSPSEQSHLSRSTERKSRLIHSSSSKRLIIVAQTSDELESAFRHKLCSYPPARALSCSEKHTSQHLLLPSGFLLDLMFKPMSQIKGVDMFWTGGGALIQRIPWSRGSTYRCNGHQYTEYVTNKYRNALVVSPTTPNNTCNYNINILVGLGQHFIQQRWSGNPKLARTIPFI